MVSSVGWVRNAVGKLVQEVEVAVSPILGSCTDQLSIALGQAQHGVGAVLSSAHVSRNHAMLLSRYTGNGRSYKK